MTAMNELKKCTKCGELKPREAFHKKADAKDKLHPHCRSCVAARGREYYAANRETHLQKCREYYANNADKIKRKQAEQYAANRDARIEWARAYRAAHPERWREYYASNAEKIRAQRRESYAADPSRSSEASHKWYMANKDKRREYNQEYRAANPDLYRQHGRNRPSRKEYNNAWRTANGLKVRAYRSARAARKRSLPDTFTAADWQAALDHFGGCCAVCGRPPGLWHILAADHWIPLSSPDCPGTVPWNIVPLCHGTGGCNNSKWNRCAGEWLVDKLGQRKGRAIQRRIEDWLTSVRPQPL